MSLSPYNITISSQCGTILYKPYRDGPISGGWNVSYSGSPDSSYKQQDLGMGTDSHRTSLAGATLEIDWIGTAIYLYGSASTGSYTVSLDGGSPMTGPSNSYQNLLNSFTGLEYGNHTAILTVVGGTQVSFERAVLTIGMGPEGATITNTTQFAATNTVGTVGGNSFFNFSQNWQPSSSNTSISSENGTVVNGLLYGWTTFTSGATVSFFVNKTTAFFLTGALNYDHQGYKVSLTPLDDTVAVKNLALNSSSRWFTQNELLYWESGLDRGRTYEVSIKNVGPGTPAFTIYGLTMMDATSTSSTTSAAASSTASKKAKASKFSRGSTAGVSVGLVAAVAIFACVLFVFVLKRRRTNKIQGPAAREFIEMDENTSMAGGNVGAIHPYFVHPSRSSLQEEAPAVPQREVDAGPVVPGVLPPDYDASWIGSAAARGPPTSPSPPPLLNPGDSSAARKRRR